MKALGVLKKKDVILRPLSEKEIQKKLYGEYQKAGTPFASGSGDCKKPAASETPGKPGASGSETSSFAAALLSQRIGAGASSAVKTPAASSVRSPAPKVNAPTAATPPKVSVKVPWGEIFSWITRGAQAGLNFLRTIFLRLGTGLGMSLLVVAGIFIGIHLLNVYRTNAMKTAKPRSLLEMRPLRKVESAARVPMPAQGEALSNYLLTGLPSEIPIRSVSGDSPLKPTHSAPTAQETRPLKQPAASPKPFSIQIATYAREEDAQALAERLKGEGLASFVRSFRRTNGKTFYSAYAGRYASFREAQEKLKELKSLPASKEFPDSFIRTLSN